MKNDDDMTRGLVGMHAQMTISDATLDRLMNEAESIGAGYHIHVAEGIEDVIDAVSKYGLRVVERLYEREVLNDKSIAVHCVNVTEDEIAMLADSGVAVVHCPESNMSNAVGVSPLAAMMERGALVGMGTDGYCADMTQSLRATHALHKLAARIPSVFWGEPQQMLFDNNRVIMNRYLNGEVGRLAAGCYADVIIADYDAPTPVDGDTYYGHILFGLNGRGVCTTIANGRVIMKERTLIGIDEERLMAKSREHAAALWKRI
jgi:cytosine/adenosine deaminase-related metal-dependent hydrolase